MRRSRPSSPTTACRAHPDPTRAPRISDSPLLGGPIGDYATEGADHARMRRLLAPAFSARRMKALQPHIAQVVERLLDRLAGLQPPADLHEALSFPLPVLVICELLGVPYADRDRFRVWSDAAANVRDRAAATEALQKLGGYMHALLERKRRAPGEDVLSDLAAARRGEITERESVGYAVGLLFAGHETTVARIDYGTLLLLANPEVKARLAQDPQVVARAVEEILRLAGGSGGGLPRYARADIAIGGVTIRAGDAVLLSVGAANRDGRVFAASDAFVADREPNPHLAFGYGSRYCLGAGLAPTELHAIFARLFARLPTLRLAVPWESLRVRTDLLTGGLEAVPVAW